MNRTTKIFLIVICLITFFANIGALPTDIMRSEEHTSELRHVD